MEVTGVTIRKAIYDPYRHVLAFVSILLDGELAIHDIRIISKDGRTLVAMPSRRNCGIFRDIAHPVNAKARAKIEAAILLEYEHYLRKLEGKPYVEN